MMGDRVPTVDLIQHAPGSSGIADMYNEVGSIAWRAWFAGKILNNNWLYEVRTLATELTSVYGGGATRPLFLRGLI